MVQICWHLIIFKRIMYLLLFILAFAGCFVEITCQDQKNCSIVMQTVEICQNKNYTMVCPPNRLLHIISANYGRLSNSSCNPEKKNTPSYTNTSCIFDVGPFVEFVCDTNPTCLMEASYDYMDNDPCPDTDKYLQIKYVCYYGKEEPDEIEAELVEETTDKIELEEKDEKEANGTLSKIEENEEDNKVNDEDKEAS